MSNDDVLLEQLADLGRVEAGHAVPPARGRARLVAAVAAGGRQQNIFTKRSLALLAAALIAVLGGAAVWLRPEAVQYTVEGASPTAEGYVHAERQAATLQFSDGSRLALAVGTRLRVTQLAAGGADVTFEQGSMVARFLRRDASRWRIHAGPFVVHVTGTEFDLAWDHQLGQLDLQMREGSVQVIGPASPEGITVRGGQHIQARAGEKSFQVTAGAAPASSAPPAEVAAAVAPAPASPESTATPSTSASTATAVPPKSASWATRVSAGDFAAVLLEADARGIAAVCDTASLDDLTALGDAARYGNRADVTTKVLTSIRARFPASTQAKSAVFLLGRMTEGGGSAAAALAWYDQYLTESPGGPFAAEALGRKLVVLQRTGNAAAARQVAAQYLRAYPKGGYASVAREIAGP